MIKPARARTELLIGDRPVGPGRPCYVIAEIGSNHNGDYRMAVDLVKRCAEAGVDAVKFQDFSREDLFVPSLPPEGTPEWEARQALLTKRWKLLPDYTANPDWWPELAGLASEVGVDFLCSPFSLEAIARLNQVGVPAWKIASGDITWHELIRTVAATEKPLIISTGASGLEEVEQAVVQAREAGCTQIILLHCVSNYPPRWEDANLLAITALAERFQVPVGLSDHSPGSVLPVAALALGCCVVEKHVTLDRKQPGLDHHFALEMKELAQLVEDIRHAELALGTGVKQWADAEEIERYWVRRGLWTTGPITAGTVIRRDQLAVLRPSQGLPASALGKAVGATAARDLAAGEPLVADDIRPRPGEHHD